VRHKERERKEDRKREKGKKIGRGSKEREKRMGSHLLIM
jgi:hypothetical protein